MNTVSCDQHSTLLGCKDYIEYIGSVVGGAYTTPSESQTEVSPKENTTADCDIFLYSLKSQVVRTTLGYVYQDTMIKRQKNE